MLGLSALWLHAYVLVLLSLACDMANFSHKLLLTDRQVSTICKAFANGSSANIEFSKIQLSKMQSGGILANLIGGIPQLIFNSVASCEKELETACPKELNSNLIVDAELNIICKRSKKKFHQLQLQE